LLFGDEPMSDRFDAPSEIYSSALSWQATTAGAIAIAALTLVLLAVGSALGFSSVSPWSNFGVSARTFQIGTGLYLVVTALLSSTIGGYLSGRLRTKWTGVHTYEVQFRDTAHGFLAWGLATVFGAAILGGAATYLVGGVETGGAQRIASAAAQGSSATADFYVAELMRPTASNAAPVTPIAPAASIAGTRNGNLTQQARVILAHELPGHITSNDRAYLSLLVAAQTGASQPEADKRVDEVLTRAKQETDQSRKTAASLSIWLAISMLVGAFSAGLAAIEGGQLRDRRWRGVFGTRAYTEARVDA
jgi:hypothetical protein